jgi:hypothetical protein
MYIIPDTLQRKNAAGRTGTAYRLRRPASELPPDAALF